MTEKDEIAELFHEKLSGHQESVNPAVWKGIQTGLQAQSAGTLSGASTALKTSGLVKSVLIGGLVVGGGLLTTWIVINEGADRPAMQSESTISTPTPLHEGSTTVSEAVSNTPLPTSEKIEYQNFAREQSLAKSEAAPAFEATTETGSTANNEGSTLPGESKQLTPEAARPALANTPPSTINAAEKANPADEKAPAQASKDKGKTQDTDSQFLTKNIPNIFTPNGDGLNDLFTIPLASGMRHQTKIFDKSGALVAEFDHQIEGWNGLGQAGIEASEGTYFYVTFVSDGAKTSKQYKGTISLKR